MLLTFADNFCLGSSSGFKAVVLKLFRLGTPQIILFEVGTPLYLLDSIPQIHFVKIADLKAHNASHREAL